jgi:hypothetical protein
VLVDRGLDIHRCEFQGQGLHWTSQAGVRSRFAFEPDEWGWLRNFNGGLMVTCGLENSGLPADVPVPAEYRFPFERTDHLPLHGRISNEAASITAREVVIDDDPRIVIRGELSQAGLYNENLWLVRTIEAPLTRPEIRILDTVENRGFTPTRHEFLYHINLGYPLVDTGTVATVPTTGGDSVFEMTDPVVGFAERVTSHDLRVDHDGFARVRVANPRTGLGVELSYRQKELPNFALWYMTGEGTYVMGLNPSSASRDPTAAAAGQRLGARSAVAYEARLRITQATDAGAFPSTRADD